MQPSHLFAHHFDRTTGVCEFVRGDTRQLMIIAKNVASTNLREETTLKMVSGRGKASGRRRSSVGAGTGKFIVLRLELIAALLLSYHSICRFCGTAVTAFCVSPMRMSSDTRATSHQARVDDTSLEAARELIMREASGSRRVTKTALLESIGYGVMDPLIYRTFESSPLPPKLRPTIHVRVAEGVHCFVQEFLGVPLEAGVSMLSQLATPTTAAFSNHRATAATAAGSSQYFELHPKIPGIGMRMTVVRLGNGELLVHSPVAPTVELLDMLRDSFPAIGPTCKVHLFSASMSPEHWVFLKHWKEIFPSAEVWAVPGPHRRLMGVQVNHDIEQIDGLPERLGREVEVAVLEGVPMVREALLLHRPTGTVLSAALLLAMDQDRKSYPARSVSDETGGPRGPAPPLPNVLRSPPPKQSRRFGDHSNSLLTPAETAVPNLADATKSDRWRRLRWGLVDKTAALLDMDTLAVFTPVKTLMRAFKGNSAEFSSRVLSWNARVFVGCHGQSPLEGPELTAMLHTALGRYAGPLNKKKAEKRGVGTRLLALVPGRRHGGQSAHGPPPEEEVSSLVPEPRGGRGPGVVSSRADIHLSPAPRGESGGVSNDAGGSGSGSGSFTSAAQTIQGAVSRPAAPTLPPAASPPAAGAAGAAATKPSNEAVSPAAAAGGGISNMSETESRARRYIQEKAESSRGAGRPLPGKAPPTPSRTTGGGGAASAEAGRFPNRDPSVTAGAGGGSGNPYVVGPDARYDETPAGSMDSEEDDPFEAPFYPFTTDGPQVNGGPPK